VTNEASNKRLNLRVIVDEIREYSFTANVAITESRGDTLRYIPSAKVSYLIYNYLIAIITESSGSIILFIIRN